MLLYHTQETLTSGPTALLIPRCGLDVLSSVCRILAKDSDLGLDRFNRMIDQTSGSENVDFGVSYVCVWYLWYFRTFVGTRVSKTTLDPSYSTPPSLSSRPSPLSPLPAPHRLPTTILTPP